MENYRLSFVEGRNMLFSNPSPVESSGWVDARLMEQQKSVLDK